MRVCWMLPSCERWSRWTPAPMAFGTIDDDVHEVEQAEAAWRDVDVRRPPGTGNLGG
jgi:hypothetical protein